MEDTIHHNNNGALLVMVVVLCMIPAFIIPRHMKWPPNVPSGNANHSFEIPRHH